MTKLLTINQLELGINRRIKARPFSDQVLPADLRQMAEVYGNMIWHHLPSVDIDALPHNLQGILNQWCGEVDSVARSPDGPGCAPRPGESGPDDCEACQ